MSWAERLDRWLYRKLYAEPEDFRALVAELEDKTRRHTEAIEMLREMVVR